MVNTGGVIVLERAVLFDEALKENLFSTSVWSVQSVFNNSINLQNKRKNELMLICGDDYPKLPHAIYVEKERLQSLIPIIKRDDTVRIADGWIKIGTIQLSLHNSPTYSSVYDNRSDLNLANVEKLSRSIHQVTDLNGFSFSLNRIEDMNHFQNRLELNAVKKVILGNETEQNDGLDYLLGRGKGLTPSGDDMLIGCLAADILYKKINIFLKETLILKLTVEQTITTTVSIHYLHCALQNKWNEPIHHLIQALTKNSTQNEIEKAVQSIIRIGHTSGLDMLTGFMAAMVLFGENKEEENG